MKNVPDRIVISDHCGASAAMLRLAEIQERVAALEIEFSGEVHRLRTELHKRCDEFDEEREQLETGLKEFVEGLNAGPDAVFSTEYGTAGFERHRKLIIYKTANTMAAIRKIYPELTDALIIRSEQFLLNKDEILRRLGNVQIAVIGCSVRDRKAFVVRLKAGAVAEHEE